MASTGSATGAAAASRRALLRALALAPLAAALPPRRAEATEYASAREVFDTVDRLEADVAARLEAVAAALPSARPFAASVRADQERHRRARARLRRRLGLPPAAPPDAAAGEVDLGRLRSAQQDLVYAHAEGLPALGDPEAVETMARDLVDLARQLTVIDLWIDAEGERG